MTDPAHWSGEHDQTSNFRIAATERPLRVRSRARQAQGLLSKIGARKPTDGAPKSAFPSTPSHGRLENSMRIEL